MEHGAKHLVSSCCSLGCRQVTAGVCSLPGLTAAAVQLLAYAAVSQFMHATGDGAGSSSNSSDRSRMSAKRFEEAYMRSSAQNAFLYDAPHKLPAFNMKLPLDYQLDMVSGSG